MNPYKVGPPVKEANFYGRTHLLKKVLRSLPVSNVVILQGQRRIGKSSLLQKLDHFLPSQTLGRGEVPLTTVNLDIQRYVQHTPLQFQKQLAQSIASTLKLELETVEQWQQENGFFRERFLPELYHHLGNRQLVILVDEFDNLGEQEENKGENIAFFRELVKGELQLKWVFAVGRPIRKLPRGYDEIFNQGGRINISFFSREDTEEVICTPESHILTYEPEAITKIWELTHGQPYLTQALCFHVFERVVHDKEGNVAGVGDVEAVVPETLAAHEGAIASIVRVPPIEERVLAAVAHLTSEGTRISRYEVRDYLLSKNDRRVERDEYNEAFDKLLQWELFVGDREGAWVSVKLLRVWLTQNVSLELNQGEELDFEYALADQSCEVAEKAMEYGKYDIAIKNSEKALKYIPNHSLAFLGLIKTREKMAQEYTRNEQFALAAEQYERIFKLDNNNPQWEEHLSDNLKMEYQKYLVVIEKYSVFQTINNNNNIFTYIENFKKAKNSLKYHKIELKTLGSHPGYPLGSNPGYREYVVSSKIQLIKAIRKRDWFTVSLTLFYFVILRLNILFVWWFFCIMFIIREFPDHSTFIILFSIIYLCCAIFTSIN